MSDVEGFTKHFTEEKFDTVVQLKRNFFHIGDDLLKVKAKVPQEPFSAGMFLGSGKPFHPSIALLDWLNERTTKFVTVDKKSAWLFLCGRDIFAKSVIESNVHRGLTLVKNSAGEVLGYGDVTGNRKIAVKTLLDRGDFLRRER